MLPEIVNKNIKTHNFLTDWQTVILRNYGMVNTSKIADVLKTDKVTVEKNAQLIGISNIKYFPSWRKRGYITIIRNNWHILSYDQLLCLLEMSEEQLEFILKEDDFLSVKLGNFKPLVNPPVYSPLTEKQIENTLKAKRIIEENFARYTKAPFDFYSYAEITKNSSWLIGDFITEGNGEQFEKIIYSYSGVYGDCLLDYDDSSFPDKLLADYQKLGVNGIWIQGLLSGLSYYPFKPDEKELYKKRRKNLQHMICKCSKYGIRVYLYFNEPRPLESGWFKGKENLQGYTIDGYSALCSSNELPYKYIYEAIKDLLKSVHDLGGIITITMSENTTNCFCRGDGKCERCNRNGLKGFEVVSKINNSMMRAIRDSGAKSHLIANIWGWNESFGWNVDDTKCAIDFLDKEIVVMAVSEDHLKINKGGVENVVVDYSISNTGPSEFSKEALEYAKTKGHRIYAKIQVNNSWECAGVPYIPVFDLYALHIKNLMAIGVQGLMLSWTLGGYPSPVIDFVNYISSEGTVEDWYKSTFKNAEEVHRGIKLLCEGFQEFPFDVNVLYYACQNMGACNFMSLENTGLKSTMVCYPYDDIDTWKGVYDKKIFESQLEKLLDKWEKGINILCSSEGRDDLLQDIINMATASYICFKSLLVQFKFNTIKLDIKNNREELLKLVFAEKHMACKLMELQSRDARIGYEASNHYFYNQNSFLEKLLNIYNIEEQLKKTDL